MAIFGIDVSEFNGTLDYTKLKSDGVKFVIVRAGYGQLESQRDVEFSQNMYGAINSGMQIGIYWMSYAWNVDTAIQEAELCAKFCNPYKSKITLPVFFDWEPDSYNYCIKNGVKPTKKLVTNMTLAFIKRIEELGYSGGYYTNESFYASFIDESRVKGKTLWIAFYVDRKPEKYDCMIQQYSSSGRISGFNGVFDLDYWYPKEAKPQTPVTPKTETRTVDITYKDILGLVSQKCGSSTVDSLAKLNGITNLATVFARFKVPSKTLDELAKEVIAGKWGSGLGRFTKITNAYKSGEIGYSYSKIQERVNQLMK